MLNQSSKVALIDEEMVGGLTPLPPDSEDEMVGDSEDEMVGDLTPIVGHLTPIDQEMVTPAHADHGDHEMELTPVAQLAVAKAKAKAKAKAAAKAKAVARSAPR
eukprot:695077-Amphidinium_carterae.1